ncbi:hypothetical protein [Aquimarina algiphila]|uniref:Bacteriocin n=1 Tax=Aquimarina algiphila TaxID=2047982 RepID=A0A554VRY9_9FLAO|nr:hypothetical protein [Aquimarina algiphila]TSE11440.1 hypothetical protein FOF46_00215 [Aquimarina algiphila]
MNLDGIKTLSKEEQSKISGAARYACEQRGIFCCELAPGAAICDAGRCIGIGGSGGCLWY